MGEILKVGVVDNYHGTDVEDTYRWLEDSQTDEVKAWVDAQNDATENYLSTYPERDKVKDKLTALWNYPKYSVPQKEGDYYYFHKNDGLQNQAIFYRTENLTSTDLEVVINPNTLNEAGTAAITNLSFTKDGNRLAYGISFDGSDWQEIRIRNLQTGEDEPDVVKWCKFSSIAWNEEGSGFYYNRFPEPGTVNPEDESNYNRVYWHKVGSSQESDQLIYEDVEDKELSFNPSFSDDYRFLLLTIWKGTENKNRIYYRDEKVKGEFAQLLADGDASYEFVGNEGKHFYFKTNNDAPKEKVIAMDLDYPEKERWVDVIPEKEDVLSFVQMINNQFVVCYLHNAHYKLSVYRVDGSLEKEVPLPNYISLSGISGKKHASKMYIGYTSYLAPQTIAQYDFESAELKPLFKETGLFPTEAFETTQVFYASADGTRIPMFLTHRKGLELTGNHPVLLYGYGGFNVSLTPVFSPAQRMWIEAGGVYAVANLRGGGEFGAEWYEAGTLERKQNVFDDFIAAAEWLIDQNYTNRKKLAIMGGSNGGLLVAACITQRPDLYGAALSLVPVTDMLRYHRFTVGRYWVTDFGNAETNAEHFEFMYKYSPLHNVREGIAYPPTLVTTADTDDRVVPLHAKKFAATLQAAQQGENPILLRVEKNAGHGLGKPTVKIIEEQTDIYSFLFKTLGIRL